MEYITTKKGHISMAQDIHEWDASLHLCAYSKHVSCHFLRCSPSQTVCSVHTFLLHQLPSRHMVTSQDPPVIDWQHFIYECPIPYKATSFLINPKIGIHLSNNNLAPKDRVATTNKDSMTCFRTNQQLIQKVSSWHQVLRA